MWTRRTAVYTAGPGYRGRRPARARLSTSVPGDRSGTCHASVVEAEDAPDRLLAQAVQHLVEHVEAGSTCPTPTAPNPNTPPRRSSSPRPTPPRPPAPTHGWVERLRQRHCRHPVSHRDRPRGRSRRRRCARLPATKKPHLSLESVEAVDRRSVWTQSRVTSSCADMRYGHAVPAHRHARRGWTSSTGLSCRTRWHVTRQTYPRRALRTPRVPGIDVAGPSPAITGSLATARPSSDPNPSGRAFWRSVTAGTGSPCRVR
jgi:hypothetical protein